ncbi:MAG: ATP-binding protein, partial [candidate division WOR-3 bacterium]|nr:ATP-binding protein [candidate division WOR-3 bacterium]MDW7988341.1 ATP-binding protein [candidate division WOR-3 bacterium]
YELMTAVVHELKTPITTIKEAISLLSEINYSKFDTQSKKILKIAEEELDRLVEIVNNLLKISAAKSENWKLKKAPYKIEEIIKEILKNYSLLTKRKKLYIKTKFATNTPKVLVDRERIYEAIANIIDNGIKFSPEGGKIQITTQLLSGKSLKLENPAVDPQKKYLKITITDNGPGIPKEKLPLIFEGTNIKETTGIPLNLGLGLIITKKIIEMHNGVIWAESNNGAKFSLALPINNKN